MEVKIDNSNETETAISEKMKKTNNKENLENKAQGMDERMTENNNTEIKEADSATLDKEKTSQGEEKSNPEGEEIETQSVEAENKNPTEKKSKEEKKKKGLFGLKKNDKEDKLKKELEEFKSKYYYLAAEMDNQQKRYKREKENLIKYGNDKILTDLIEVVDNFERTIQALNIDEDEKIKNIVVGVEMVKGQFSDILKKYGLTPVESVGKIFDPNFHEAVSQREEEGKEDHEILEEFQKGYTLNGRLIRASKVVVCKGQ